MDIANSRTKTSFKAQTCLYVARGTEFDVLLPTDDGSYTVFKEINNEIANAKVHPFAPNPSTQTSVMEYQLDKEEIGVVSIYDYTGRSIVVHTLSGSGNYVLDTNNYPAGIYVYVVTINGFSVLQNKLIITK